MLHIPPCSFPRTPPPPQYSWWQWLCVLAGAGLSGAVLFMPIWPAVGVVGVGEAGEAGVGPPPPGQGRCLPRCCGGDGRGPRSPPPPGLWLHVVLLPCAPHYRGRPHQDHTFILIFLFLFHPCSFLTALV